MTTGYTFRSSTNCPFCQKVYWGSSRHNGELAHQDAEKGRDACDCIGARIERGEIPGVDPEPLRGTGS